MRYWFINQYFFNEICQLMTIDIYNSLYYNFNDYLIK